MDVATEGAVVPSPTAKENDEASTTATENNNFNRGNPQRKSRFKVAIVDKGVDDVAVNVNGEDPVEAEEAQDSFRPLATSDEPTSPAKNVGFSVGESPPGDGERARHPSVNFYNPGDTHQGSYDTQNQRTFAHNTLETLPHLDHYRNLLSTAEHMRARPTLLELHEMAVEQPLGPGDRLLDAENGAAAKAAEEEAERDKGKAEKPGHVKFGWIKGVLLRCLLNIYGVMLFLRLSWCVGQAGIGMCCLVVLLSAAVTTITTLSMSAICTNGEVKGGGAYFMISRSLGPEFGGAIGIIFSLANAVAVAMYIVGFAETIKDLLKVHDLMMVDDINDIRIISIITAFALLGLTLLGMDWVIKAQMFLLGILFLSLGNFTIGSFLPPSEYKLAHGFTGYSGPLILENLPPAYEEGESFFSVFAIFFPAATGILAGANISGDLKNASTAIPKGTLLAILISTITYIIMAIMVGACVERYAPGFPPVIAGNESLAEAAVANMSSSVLEMGATTGSYLVNGVSDLVTHTVDLLAANGEATNTTLPAAMNWTSVNCSVEECHYGLMNDMQVMQLVSVWGPITVAGIISATLSSAIASLVGAPKVFQAVCRDKLFPGIFWFGKGYGRSDEPHRAYFLAFIIALACLCIGDLNAIAPLISNFFLMSYCLINYSCFDASLAKSPGWRPAFKYYSMWISLLGAVLCLGVMFVINWWTALITFAVVCVLYVYTHYSKPDVNWGSSRQAHVYRNALTSSLQLVSVLEHVKNFRPQILVLSGFPSDRPALVDFATNITRNIGMMVCGQIIIGDTNNLKDTRRTTRLAYAWLHKRRSKSFYSSVMAGDLRTGAQALMQCAGVGKMRPNTLFLGFKADWRHLVNSSPETVEDYFNVIHDAFHVNYGVGILRMTDGLDYSHLASILDQVSLKDENSSQKDEAEDENVVENGGDAKLVTTQNKVPDSFIEGTPLHRMEAASRDTLLIPNSRLRMSRNSRNSQDSRDTLDNASSDEEVLSHGHHRNFLDRSRDDLDGSRDDLDRSRDDLDQSQDNLDRDMEKLPRPLTEYSEENTVNKEVLRSINHFHRKQKKGHIDVWWLFDDGGLTLLIPYILSTKSAWKGCKLRVFMAGTKTRELDRDQRRMATLLSKFRIEYSSMTVIPDISKQAKPENKKEFENLIKDWMLDTEQGETQESHPWKISEDELAAQKDKTNRHLRLQELLQEHSSDSTLIVMTLPMPRKGLCSAGLYMAWVETITKDLPPILLLRGNQQSVLTYYS